jgi:hypothetical protein
MKRNVAITPIKGVGNGKMINIPSPNPGGSKKVVEMPVAKKKPGKGSGPKPYPMPKITPGPRTGGGIISSSGRNVNSVYNTY